MPNKESVLANLNFYLVEVEDEDGETEYKIDLFWDLNYLHTPTTSPSGTLVERFTIAEAKVFIGQLHDQLDVELEKLK